MMSKGVDREISLKALAGFAAGLLVVCVVAAIFVWYFSKFLRGYGESQDPPPPALAAAREPYLPPGPRLQAEPEKELVDLMADEDSVLESYGWVDESAGIARVPIERAIAMALGEEGGETAHEPEPAAAEGVH